MNHRIALVGILIAVLSLGGVQVALAHGEPIISVDPAVVGAGGSITVTGSEMEPGEVFTLTLVGATATVPLGEATADGEGEEAGFVMTVILPADLEPGSYTLQASSEEGETAVADLTVTAAASEADPGPAMVEEPSGEPHLLDRAKPAAEVAGTAALAVVIAILGVWLIRRR